MKKAILNASQNDFTITVKSLNYRNSIESLFKCFNFLFFKFFNESSQLVLIFLLSVFSLQAATITSTATGGTWSTGSTWVGGVAPSTGDTVIIATTGIGSVNIGSTLTQTALGSVTVNSGATLTIITSGVTVTFGALTVNSGGAITIKRTTTILGATNISGRINFGSTSSTTRTITFTGAVTLNSGAVWDETNMGLNTVKDTYVIKNNFINNATTFTPLTGSAHNFTGAGALSGSTVTAMPKATFTAAYTNNGLLTCATLLTVTTVTLTNNGTITATTSLAGSGKVVQGAAGVLNIGGTSLITTLTATASGNIVNYTGAAQTIHTGNYSVLNFSGSGIKTLSTGTTTIGSLTLSGTATTTTVVNLTITNSLIINSGTTFTTGATFTQSVGGATSVSGSLVLAGTGAKTFTGDVTLNSDGVWNESAISIINFGGNFTNNATTFSANTGAHNFTGATKSINGATETVIPKATFTGAYTINSLFTCSTLLTITGVSVTNNGIITASTSVTGTGGIVQGATGILNLGGTVGITTLTASAAGNIVDYTGSNQTGYVTNYSTLILSGSGTKTFATSPTVNALLSMEDTAIISIVPTYGSSAALQYNTATARVAGIVWITPFVASGGIIIKNTGEITTPGAVQIGNNTNVPLNINAGATLTPGANLITFHGDFINNGTLTSGSGGMTIAGTTATQSIDDFTTTGAITFTKTSGTATLTGNISGEALTINGSSSGTLNLGVGQTHTFTGGVTLTGGVLNGGSSTLNENAVSTTAWNGTASVFVPASGTVNFGASGAQTIVANSSFYNISFSGSGIKTLSGATTVNNNFSVSGTAVVNLGTGLTHTAISLILGGASQVTGTWGSTASTALNKNATWFGSSSTGIINVSCVAPSAPTSGGNRTICSGASIPALTVTVSGGQTVDWYNQPSGGTLLLLGATSYTPSGAGTFYAETRLTSTGCLSAARTSVKLTVNTNPTVLSLTGNTICESPGGNGTIISTTSFTGINYQLYNSSNVAVQTAKSGTGAALTWSSLAAGIGYYVVGTNATSGCSSTSSGVNVATNPNPTTLVLSGSTICTSPGDDGVITSTTSQTGVNYQLYNSSNAVVQSSQIGSGSMLSWSDLSPGSGYYVKGVNSTTGCISSNSTSVNITTIANPIVLVITGSSICASAAGTGTITSTTSEIGVDYQLNDSLGNDIGNVVSGTGSGLTFTGIAAGTGYYVEGENTTTGCLLAPSNSVNVVSTSNPTNKTVTVSSASVCTGTGANIIIAGSLATENYQLRDDSSNTAIGTSVVGNGSSINLASGNLTANTTFNILATVTSTGCSTEMTTTPTITMTLSNTAGIASSAPTVCISTVLTPITHVTTKATGIGTVTGLPTGVTAAWATNTITISGTPTTSGTFNYSIPLTGGCGSVNATGTITVNPNKTVSAASSSPTLCVNTSLTPITHSTIGATGIGTATGLPTGLSASWVSNTITISGTPTPSGIFNYSIPLTGGCGNATATGTINVNNLAVGGTISGGSTICSGTNSTTLTLTGNSGSVTKWQSSTVSNFASSITDITNTSNSLTVTNVSSTLYYRAVVTNGSCSVANSSVATIQYDVPVGMSAITPLVSQLSGNATTTITASGVVGINPVVSWYTGSGQVGLLGTGLTSPAVGAGTYYAVVTGSCGSSVELSTTIRGFNNWTGAINTLWNVPGNWSENVVPDATMDAAIGTGKVAEISANDAVANSITITGTGTLTVKSGKNLTLTNGFTTALASSLVLENNANLIQLSATANTTPITVKRDTNALIRLDYTMWSSPVTNQKLFAFSPLTSIAPTIRFYTYTTATNFYNSVSAPSTTDFEAGKGYLIRLPYNHPTAPAVWTGAFTGIPNNGTKTVALSNIDDTHQYNAVGNPYPSPISVAQFMIDNASKIEPTIYFWRKTNNAAKPSYCTWNSTSQTFTSNGEAFSVSPNGIIQTGQGFIVEAKGSANSLEFNNGQRVLNNVSHFFKSTNATATSSSESHRIWLNLTGANSEYSQAVLGYFTNATPGEDNYDSKLFNDGSVSLSMKIGTSDYTIQGRPVPFDASEVVPLNYKVTTAGSYTISIDRVDGLFTGGAQTIFLRDNLLGTCNNLSTSTYTFTSNPGTFESRFELLYQNSLLSNNTAPAFNANEVVIYHQKSDLIINTGVVTMSSIKIFNIKGAVLFDKKEINASETRVDIGSTNEVLLVEIVTTEGVKVVKKVYSELVIGSDDDE